MNDKTNSDFFQQIDSPYDATLSFSQKVSRKEDACVSNLLHRKAFSLLLYDIRRK